MGIRKLMITYSKRPHTVSQLSVCCKNIQIQLDTFSDEYCATPCKAPEDDVIEDDDYTVSEPAPKPAIPKKDKKKSASIAIPKR
jgi:hypothetical protein